MRTTIVILSLFSFVLLAFVSVTQLFVSPLGWPEPLYDFSKNPLSNDKIELGRTLFYDPILSRNNTISCESCHNPYNAFAQIDHRFSRGIDNNIGTRNAPVLVNLAWQKKFMWDGAINHLDMQTLAPITHPKEMDEQLDHLIIKLKSSAVYPKLFYKAYQDSTITGERVLKAMAQFLLTMVSSNSKYDSVMRRESVFTDQEKNGYYLFKKNCNSCHTEPLFFNNELENNGLPLDKSLNDFGRMAITHLSTDSLKFKVPTLRNIQVSPPYMHDGRFTNLQDVLKHYTSHIQKSKTLSDKLQVPIVLNSNQKEQLIAFLQTLTDHTFILNSQFSSSEYNLPQNKRNFGLNPSDTKQSIKLPKSIPQQKANQ